MGGFLCRLPWRSCPRGSHGDGKHIDTRDESCGPASECPGDSTDRHARTTQAEKAQAFDGRSDGRCLSETPCRSEDKVVFDDELASHTIDHRRHSFTSSGDQVGTKEYEVCSFKGLCDYTTGTCRCFPGYGSSDGQNHKGSLGDCG